MSVVAIIGSRRFKALDRVQAAVADLSDKTTVVSGHAQGVDREAERAANERELAVISFRVVMRDRSGRFEVDRWRNEENTGPISVNGHPLSWPDFTSAAKHRNWAIVRGADRVIAFWDGMSGGTAHGIAAAVYLGIIPEVVLVVAA